MAHDLFAVAVRHVCRSGISRCHHLPAVGMSSRKRDAAVRRGALIVRNGIFSGAHRVQVEGRELIPAKTACIFMANHVSNLDPPALIPNIPGRTSAFVKRSLMRIPFFGLGLRLAEFIPVERSGDRESAQESVAAARHDSQEGHPYHHLRRGHPIARRSYAALQEGAILSGHGDRGAMHSSLDMGDQRR